MKNNFGFSVYVSTFELQISMLEKFKNTNSYIFTSFHISEELNSSYCLNAEKMCKYLYELGYKIIGDVSKKTLGFFGINDIIKFAKHMNLYALRIDYGFSNTEILDLAKDIPIAINASTIDDNLLFHIKKNNLNVLAIHNFYPRPETGIDEIFFKNMNDKINAYGINIFAFIPGDKLKRGPLFEGLPTLEKHRNYLPYISFLDLCNNYNIEGIFIGDPLISDFQSDIILNYLNDDVVIIPAFLEQKYSYIYDKVYTIRPDSPNIIMRFQESREYSCAGELKEPFNCIERKRGSITIDNKLYGRYSGEIQIVKKNLNSSEKINVIGNVNNEYIDLLDSIHNGAKFKLFKI